MNADTHAENRAWTFDALDQLEGFLEDPDFEGNEIEEREDIQRKRKDLQENKYRVVVLGAFNVGKSMLINAFLGDEYLPTVLEECTTKITHIVKADRMRTVLHLAAPATEDELNALRTVVDMCGIGAEVHPSDEGPEVFVVYSGSTPKELLKSLQTLVTSNADEDFPQLRTLRDKFDEITIELPTDLLEEDIALVDSPGVHSISETNKKITQSIIPRSHLVVCLIDSQNAGNEQNRSFIEGIVKDRNRKVFFVINKSDQLNKEEIDPKGRRGPAKDLVRSLKGIVESPELFFVSSLYSVVSSQLRKRKIGLVDLDGNNKIKVPFGMHESLLNADDPADAVAVYLSEHSNIGALKNRLLDYLYTENREVAIVEAVCRYVDGVSWKYARPLEIKLQMARDIPRLDELVAMRNDLDLSLEEEKRRHDRVLERFNAMATGGIVDGVEFPGYNGMVDQGLNEKAVEEQVAKPLEDWINNDRNFRAAKKGGYEPLRKEVDARLDAYIQHVQLELNRHAEMTEQRALESFGATRERVEAGERRFIDASRAKIGPLQAGLGGSYFGFAIVGAILGAAIGVGAMGALQGWQQQEALMMGGGVGAAAGLLLGLIFRAATGRKVLKRRLVQQMREKVRKVLLDGVSADGQKVAPVREQLKQSMERRRQGFVNGVEAASDDAIAAIRRELDEVEAEEREIRREQEEVISRLEPKANMLTALGERARGIVDMRSTRPAVVQPV